MPAEVEAKFIAAGADALASLAREPRLADAELDPPRVIEETDRYLDTADGRLGARRWACRLRERDGTVLVSLKGPRNAGPTGRPAWLHDRPEVEGPATRDVDPAHWPPSEARAFLGQLAGGEPLRERLRLEQRRTEREVRLGGRALGTLTLDDVTVVGPNGPAGTIHAVELELHATDADAPAELDRLARALAARPDLTPDPRTKLEHALHLLGIE